MFWFFRLLACLLRCFIYCVGGWWIRLLCGLCLVINGCWCLLFVCLLVIWGCFYCLLVFVYWLDDFGVFVIGTEFVYCSCVHFWLFLGVLCSFAVYSCCFGVCWEFGGDFVCLFLGFILLLFVWIVLFV